MGLNDFRSLRVLLLLVCGFARPAGDPPLSGRVIANPMVASAVVPAKLRVLLKSQGRILGQAAADSSGRFGLNLSTALRTADSSYDFFCMAPGLDTLYLRSLPPGKAGLTEIRLLFPCEPDTTASGDIICPKCRQEDQVYPMVYGDPIVITRHFDTAGRVSYERTPRKQPQADSLVKAARYYCRRDKITF